MTEVKHGVYHVVKFYIPKGAQYVKGVDYDCSYKTDGKPVYQASILKVHPNNTWVKKMMK